MDTPTCGLRSRGVAFAVANTLAALAVFASPAALATAASAQASFRGIGDLPGGEFRSEVLGLSSDGRVILGRSAATDIEDEGFVLRLASGELQPLAGPAGRRTSSEPRAITLDGALIVGKMPPTPASRGPCEAARWTSTDGWTGLGDLEGGDFASQALDVSGDGHVIVGWGASDTGLVAVRWVDGVIAELGDLPGGPNHAAASLVSQDGSTIAGTGTSERGPEVFVWQQATGMVALGDLEGGEFSSEPFALSPDGQWIAGEAASARGVEAFRWSKETGLQALGDLPGGEFQSMAFGVSADGRVVVGTSQSARGPEAFVWDAEHGLRSVADALRSASPSATPARDGASDVAPDATLDATLDGWQLTEAVGVSADGRTIAGNGTNREGQSEGWVAQLP